MTDVDDATLVAQAQTGSQDAFCELVERHKSQAVSIAMGMLGHLEEAKDCVQVAFVKAYQSLPSFRAQSAFKTWLYRILVNECQDMLRSRARSKRWLWWPTPDASADDEQPNLIDLVPGTGPLASDTAHDREVAVQLRRAITRLSPRQRAVVTLRYLHELSLEEVAESLGCATGTVKAQLARALRHLRTHLNGTVEVMD